MFALVTGECIDESWHKCEVLWFLWCWIFYRDKIDFFFYSIVFNCNGYIIIAQAINDIGRKRKKVHSLLCTLFGVLLNIVTIQLCRI